MSAPTVIEALEALFEPSGDRDFGEWFEEKLKHARAALDHLRDRRSAGHGHKSALIAALGKYDEAEDMRLVTTGEMLAYWEQQSADAHEEIADLVDDLGPVEMARHALFSPAL